MARLIGILIPIGIQIALLAATYSYLPEKVASQFGFNGQPTSWMPPLGYAAIVAFEAVILNLSLFGLAAWIETAKSFRWVNIPHKAYWMETPERTEVARAKLVNVLRAMGWGVNLVVLGGQLLILGQNGVPVPFRINSNVFVGVTLVAAIVHVVWTLRLFKPR